MPKHPTIVTLVNYQTPKNGILSNAIIIQLGTKRTDLIQL